MGVLERITPGKIRGITESKTAMMTTTIKDATSENQNPDNDFDARVLMSLVLDLDLLDDTVRRVRIQVHALAKNHTVAIPEAGKA